MLAPRAVLFDFDYTLADSSPGVIESVNWAMRSMGLPRRADDAIRRTIGLSLARTFTTLTGDAAEGAGRFAELFIERADEVMAERTSLLPGAREAVLALANRGYRLGVVSTKFRRRIETVLARDGLRAPFEVIVGGEDVPAHKPDPACLLAALAHLRIGARDALYVGDSEVDGEAAHRAGVALVGVLTGTTTREALGTWRPSVVLEHVGALPDWLEDNCDGR
ncbi:HAD-IA family hydrolase [Candidatus Poribacteria bacterium]|jgi:phosphoglycolate phosphatase|nr:HAD-IA family hydrolase [Candidatus Poribacteria bacterium]MBT5531535.1 HAD-IA family hydrolase [Candidatus Poribacteria bacterium]MBT5711112.1 HAD-IA family hydrolase [Candidatus Poribacteria bacterium]MBT7806355.1 HAD-IA family hydrolase [Candidatus Poribacteria bacterium]